MPFNAAWPPIMQKPHPAMAKARAVWGRSARATTPTATRHSTNSTPTSFGPKRPSNRLTTTQPNAPPAWNMELIAAACFPENPEVSSNNGIQLESM